MDEEEKKKKPNIFLVIGLIIIIILIFGYIAFKLLNRGEVKNEEEDMHKNVVKDTISIEKLTRFVNTGMYNDYGYEGLAYDFAKGIDKLSKTQKMKFAFQNLVNIEYETEKVDRDNLHEKYKNDPYLSDSSIIMSQLSSRSLEKEYEKFFNETLTYDEESLKKMKSCPSVYKFDSRINKIYLFNECNLSGDTLLLTKTYNIKSEGDYYYVYQYVGIMKKKKQGEEHDIFTKIKSGDEVDVESFTDNEDKFDKLVWKFDKNYNFISTTNEG